MLAPPVGLASLERWPEFHRPLPVDRVFWRAGPPRDPTTPPSAGIQARIHAGILEEHRGDYLLAAYGRSAWATLDAEFRELCQNLMLQSLAASAVKTLDTFGNIEQSGAAYKTQYSYARRLFGPSGTPLRLFNQTDDYAANDIIFTYINNANGDAIASFNGTLAFTDASFKATVTGSLVHVGATVAVREVALRQAFSKEVSSIGNDERPWHWVDIQAVAGTPNIAAGQTIACTAEVLF